MDYTIITKTQVKYIEKLQKNVRPSENEPKILTTYPNGKQEVSYSIQRLNDFWNELINNYTKEWVMTPEEAIAEASRVMTIRQGDLIYLQRRQAPRTVHKEDIIRIEINGEEKLYCKIK